MDPSRPAEAASRSDRPQARSASIAPGAEYPPCAVTTVKAPRPIAAPDAGHASMLSPHPAEQWLYGWLVLPLTVAFVGASTGTWSIERLETVAGDQLASASRLAVVEGSAAARPVGDAVWVLRGVISNERYVNRGERSELAARQEPLGRAGSTRAALIPVKKSEAWWDLAQDERRRIFEERSHHIATGLEYLPAVARRLHHGRDLGEPFDFLTWFEFAPEHGADFEKLVLRLRATEEWNYIEREIDIRLAR
jgi:chlorite dismutase